jgi:hypothetical protein
MAAQTYNTFANEEAGNAPSKPSGITRKSVAAGAALLALLGVSATVSSRGYSMLDVVRRQRECRTKRLVAAMASDRRPSATLFAHR